mmetsp:Transcript_4519/g.6851  ORF Transcript_4519/g.6851 Transcript_4519/m.6851 type:complete len:95 (+) Transcript_4519:1157-1441(+)
MCASGPSRPTPKLGKKAENFPASPPATTTWNDDQFSTLGTIVGEKPRALRTSHVPRTTHPNPRTQAFPDESPIAKRSIETPLNIGRDLIAEMPV